MRWIAVSLFLALTVSRVVASGPVPIGDVELAKSSVIVIGYWPKAKRTFRALKRDDTIREWETQTELVITKVLHGSVKPGRARITYGPGCGWDPDGTGLNSASSTMIFTDIDVSKPNMWFLVPGKSWDKRDTRSFLTVRSFECIQPASLQPLFGVLRRGDRDMRVGDLLSSKSSLVVERALGYIAGYRDPWPLLTFDYLWISSPRQPEARRVYSCASRLLQVAENRRSPNRDYALALYAEMKGTLAVPILRRFLRNESNELRTIAAGYLVRLRSVTEFRQMEDICRRAEGVDLVCQLIKAMEISKDLRYVPSLIQFLQGPGDDRAWDETIESPSICARRALKVLTAFTFPNDVSRSMLAWQALAHERDSRRRREGLLRLLGNWEEPLKAVARPVLNSDGSYRTTEDQYSKYVVTRITVTNCSPQAFWISAMPSSTSVQGDESLSNGGFDGYPESKKPFVRLAPGQSISFTMPVNEELYQPPAVRSKIYLQYTENGLRHGARAWMGVVLASIEPLARIKPPKTK